MVEPTPSEDLFVKRLAKSLGDWGFRHGNSTRSVDPNNANIYRAHRDDAASLQTNGNLALNSASAEVYEKGRYNLFLNSVCASRCSPSATAQEIKDAYEDCLYRRGFYAGSYNALIG
jgi:hypothetical protein